MRSPKSPLFPSGRLITEPGDSTLGSDPLPTANRAGQRCDWPVGRGAPATLPRVAGVAPSGSARSLRCHPRRKANGRQCSKCSLRAFGRLP